MVPATEFLEDDGEGGEGKVEDSVNEGGVEGDEEADWSCEEGEGADEIFVSELFECDVPLFVAGMEGPVSGLETEAASFIE